MSIQWDTTFDHRDFTSDQLHTVGGRSIAILAGVPETDTFHRQLTADLKSRVDLLGHILGEEVKSEFTLLKSELDAERDSLFVGLSQSIKVGARHPKLEKKSAAVRLIELLQRRRPKLHLLSLDENTAELTLLFADLDKAAADLATLDLGDWYAKLKEVNGELVESILEEAKSVTGEPAPALTEVKKDLSLILRTILHNFAYQARMERAPYVELSSQLEEALSPVRTVSTRRQNRKAKAKAKPALAS